MGAFYKDGATVPEQPTPATQSGTLAIKGHVDGAIEAALDPAVVVPQVEPAATAKDPDTPAPDGYRAGAQSEAEVARAAGGGDTLTTT